MYTQCPHCKAAFQISAEQLKTAGGDVRCGQCLSIFSALGYLSEDIPEPAPATPRDADQYSNWADEVLDISLDAPIDDSSEHFTTPPQTTETVFSADTEGEFNHEADEPQTQAIADGLEVDDSEIDTPEIDSPETDSPEDDVVASDSSLETEAPFGDIEAATADLDISISTDTTPQDPTVENEVDTEFAEFFADSFPKNSAPFSNEPEDAIIIEAEDLTPIASQDYAGSPREVLAALQKQPPPVFQTREEAATNIESLTTEAEPATAQQNHTEIIHVPARILEDLHTDKAAQLRPSTTPWAIASVLLMLLIVLQVAYFTRDELAKDPMLRPWLEQMCEFADCTLAQAYDIQQIEIIGRDVRTHPTAHKALIASTTIINNARFAQPYPLLTLVFSDINGVLLAQRRFMPREYLSRDIDISAGMTPNLPIQIELELADPGKAAVNYEFHAEAGPSTLSRRPIL
jgi:predicted Zn finger-like uncharacterized protein